MPTAPRGKVRLPRIKKLGGIRPKSPSRSSGPSSADDDVEEALLRELKRNQRMVQEQQHRRDQRIPSEAPLRHPPPPSLPNTSGLTRLQQNDDEGSTETSSVSTPQHRHQRQAYMVSRKSPPRDSSLLDIINMRKIKPTRLREEDLSDADESPTIHQQRKRPKRSLVKRPVSSSEESTDEEDESSSDNIYYTSSSADEDVRGRLHSHHRAGLGQSPPSLRVPIDPLEQETAKAVRKAKLLARITQLTEKGVKPRKNYTWKTAEEELLVEVARMEVLEQRSKKIEQGRAMLMMSVGGVEKGANYCDDQAYLGGFKFCLNDFSKHLLKDIDRYDDCLEKGVDAILGPPENRAWWQELLFLLIPAMIMYSLTNQMKKDPAYTAEVIKQNPELRAEIAREIVQDLRRTGEIHKVTGMAESINDGVHQQQQQQQQEDYRQTTPPDPMPRPARMVPPRSHPQPAPAPRQPPAPASGPQPIPNAHPLGDFGVDPAQRAAMQAEIDGQRFIQAERTRMEAQQRFDEHMREMEQKMGGAHATMFPMDPMQLMMMMQQPQQAPRQHSKQPRVVQVSDSASSSPGSPAGPPLRVDIPNAAGRGRGRGRGIGRGGRHLHIHPLSDTPPPGSPGSGGITLDLTV